MRSIFAIEMCLQLDADLQRQLSRAVTENSLRMTYGDKWQRYCFASNLLLQNAPLWHRGCWDFFDDSDRAEKDFHMWVQGMLTREGARTEPSGSADPYRREPRYLTFTMAAVLVAGSDCHNAIQALCKMPEDVLWQRSTFARILNGVRNLNFASVVKDTMYLIPGDLGWGLTAADLSHEKFAYLRTIV